MGIGDYTSKLPPAANHKNDLFVAPPDMGTGIRVETPLEAPVFGTQIKAWLSNFPGLESKGALKQAGAEVDRYITLDANQRINSRACLNGFVDALKEAFGPEIADMCVKTAGAKPEQYLTARQVNAAINVGTKKNAEYQKIRDQAVNQFLNRDAS